MTDKGHCTKYAVVYYTSKAIATAKAYRARVRQINNAKGQAKKLNQASLLFL